MKGIILAGGSGTRLYPITKAISKQLMPVYDKPMIYYPLSILLLSGIKEILIITTPEDQSQFIKLLGDGSSLGCIFKYAVQEKPNGLAEAFLIGEEFIGKDNVCLILGDNIFYGSGLSRILQRCAQIKQGAKIFAFPVNNPGDYGVVEMDENSKAISIEEKPEKPKSNFAIPGLYYFDNSVINFAKKIKPSQRGELEITSINRCYLKAEMLNVEIMPRGSAWLDTGTFDSLSDASEFVRVIEKRQQHKIGCIEEIAWRMRYIDNKQLKKISGPLQKSGYGKYLLNLLS